MTAQAQPAAPALQKIPGFESTAYAFLQGRVVWAGGVATAHSSRARHPRDFRAPWRPDANCFDAAKLQRGATVCRQLFDVANMRGLQAKGLMLWLTGQPMAFPLNHAVARFDAVRNALLQGDLKALEAAAIRVLGLGHGLTPSGDDFVGGVFFALGKLPANAFGASWLRDFPEVAARIRSAANTATNVISAALLGDLMAGESYSVLHDLLAAFESDDAIKIEAACEHLMRLGASSGSDILAGVLLALSIPPFALDAAALQNSP
jgi:hypothetical protein